MVQNQQTTNDFPLLPPRSPMKTLCFPGGNWLVGPRSSAPQACPAHWPLEGIHRQHCCCPILKVGKTVALKAQCWSQDRKAHLCLGTKLLTPPTQGFARPVFRASVLLQFRAKMCPPSWPALGESVPGRSKPAGSCWPKHPIASETSRGTDAIGVSAQGRSLFYHPQLPHWVWAGHHK